MRVVQARPTLASLSRMYAKEKGRPGERMPGTFPVHRRAEGEGETTIRRRERAGPDAWAPFFMGTDGRRGKKRSGKEGVCWRAPFVRLLITFSLCVIRGEKKKRELQRRLTHKIGDPSVLLFMLDVEEEKEKREKKKKTIGEVMPRPIFNYARSDSTLHESTKDEGGKKKEEPLAIEGKGERPRALRFLATTVVRHDARTIWVRREKEGKKKLWRGKSTRLIWAGFVILVGTQGGWQKINSRKKEKRETN